MNESISSIGGDQNILEALSKYYMALLILLGTFGNIFCIFAYMTSEVKKYGSTRYLIALSISDLGFVFSMALTWIKSFDLNWHDLPFVCETSTYVSSVCCFLSGWYVAALSAERCLAVCWPYVARRVCTAERTTILIICLALLGAAINAPLFYVAKSIPERRGQDDIDSIEKSMDDQSIVNKSVSDQPIIYQVDNHQSVNDPSIIDGSRNDQSIIDDSHNHKRIDTDNLQNDPWGNYMTIENPSISQFAIYEAIDHQSKIHDSTKSDHNIDDRLYTTAAPESITYHCGVDPNTEPVYRAFTTIDTVFSFSIPLLLTLILNVAIACRLCRAARERKVLTSPNSESNCNFRSRTSSYSFTNRSTKSGGSKSSSKTGANSKSGGNSKNDENSKTVGNLKNGENPSFGRNAMLSINKEGGRVKTRIVPNSNNRLFQRKITSVLVAKCVAYLILNLPSYLHRILLAFEAPVGADENHHQQDQETNDESNNKVVESMVFNRILEMLVYLLFYTQFSTNFLLYSFNACVNGAVRLRRDSQRRSLRKGQQV